MSSDAEGNQSAGVVVHHKVLVTRKPLTWLHVLTHTHAHICRSAQCVWSGLCIMPLPFHVAELVLENLREWFIEERDANAVIMELLDKDIINGGDQEQISMAHDPMQRNQKKCTDYGLKTVCDVIIGVKGRQAQDLHIQSQSELYS